MSHGPNPKPNPVSDRGLRPNPDPCSTPDSKCDPGTNPDINPVCNPDPGSNPVLQTVLHRQAQILVSGPSVSRGWNELRMRTAWAAHICPKALLYHSGDFPLITQTTKKRLLQLRQFYPTEGKVYMQTQGRHEINIVSYRSVIY